jgi:hypothetical protein
MLQGPGGPCWNLGSTPERLGAALERLDAAFESLGAAFGGLGAAFGEPKPALRMPLLLAEPVPVPATAAVTRKNQGLTDDDLRNSLSPEKTAVPIHSSSGLSYGNGRD